MDREDMKRRAAEAAVAYVPASSTLGVGSGSTVEHFIRGLDAVGRLPATAVAASERTRRVLEELGVPVVDLAADAIPLALYVDGADEIDGTLQLLKGAGGALAREKVIATASARFVCIADESKLVRSLGSSPVAVEVLPAVRGYVERELRSLGGTPVLRADFTTDNGNVIFDVSGLDLADACAAEFTIKGIPGVVECGIFARRHADVVLLGTAQGVRKLGA